MTLVTGLEAGCGFFGGVGYVVGNYLVVSQMRPLTRPLTGREAAAGRPVLHGGTEEGMAEQRNAREAVP